MEYLGHAITDHTTNKCYLGLLNIDKPVVIIRQIHTLAACTEAYQCCGVFSPNLGEDRKPGVVVPDPVPAKNARYSDDCGGINPGHNLND